MTRVLPWLLLIGVSWFGGCQYAKNREAEMRIYELIRTRERLAAEAGRVDTVYVTDTLRLTKVRTVTDSVLRVDTLIHRDTVRVLVERERLACDAALTTCETRVAQRDSIIGTLDSIIALDKQRHAGNWKTKLGWLLAGAAAASLIPR